MNKERAKEYLIKSKLYRFLALVFACMGVLLFCYTLFRAIRRRQHPDSPP
jgi:hypothetical protein